MPVEYEELKGILENSFNDAIIGIKALVPDDDHWEITISSSEFNNISKLAQHKLVHSKLKGSKAEFIHALSIKTVVS